MFFYVSFLRPPPSTVSPSGKLFIVPQIVNDLRTEFYGGAQDIYYLWQSPGTATARRKLTTWREETTYKELTVPLPNGVREGQHWRLVLSTGTGGPVDLTDTGSIGREPFAIISMPIQITRGAGGEKKQEQIERVYGLGAIGKLKITEQTSFDLDKKIWDSGIGLSCWITTEFLAGTLPARLKDAKTMIELGAGTGVVSLTVAALDMMSRIITTDLGSAMPLLKHNIVSNIHLFAGPPEAAVLDWDEELPQYCESGFDAIVMADVTYNTASFPALVSTLARLVKACVKPPVILLGYKQRDEAERTLWTLAKEASIEFSQVDQVIGAGGQPIEIWVSM